MHVRPVAVPYRVAGKGETDISPHWTRGKGKDTVQSRTVRLREAPHRPQGRRCAFGNMAKGARSQEPAVSLSAWPEQKRQTKCGEPSKFKLMQPTSQPSKQMRNCTDTQASQSLSCNPVWVGGLDSTLHIGVCVCHILCRRGRQRPAGCVRSKWQNTVPPSSPLARPTSKQAAGQGILDE